MYDKTHYKKKKKRIIVDFQVWFVVHSLSCVQPFAIPWTAAHQASLSFTISRSLPKLMSIEWMMPSNRLILCHPFLLMPSIIPNQVFSNEMALCITWPKYWCFSFSFSPSNEYSGNCITIPFFLKKQRPYIFPGTHGIFTAQMTQYLDLFQNVRGDKVNESTDKTRLITVEGE